MTKGCRQIDGKDRPPNPTRRAAAATGPTVRPSFRWQPAALTALPFAGLWGLFAGSTESWVVGLPCILAAAGLAGLADEKPSTVRPAPLPGFLCWFMVQSVRGGVDVARRALMPGLPIAPGVYRRRSALPSGARPWLANAITLLPGTLAARLEDDRIDIHAIERSAAVEAEIERAERRIAALMDTRAVRPQALEAGS